MTTDRVIGAKMTVGHRTGAATVETIAETAQTQTAVATVATPLHATTPAATVAVKNETRRVIAAHKTASVVAIADETTIRTGVVAVSAMIGTTEATGTIAMVTRGNVATVMVVAATEVTGTLETIATIVAGTKVTGTIETTAVDIVVTEIGMTVAATVASGTNGTTVAGTEAIAMTAKIAVDFVKSAGTISGRTSETIVMIVVVTGKSVTTHTKAGVSTVNVTIVVIAVGTGTTVMIGIPGMIVAAIVVTEIGMTEVGTKVIVVRVMIVTATVASGITVVGTAVSVAIETIEMIETSAERTAVIETGTVGAKADALTGSRTTNAATRTLGEAALVVAGEATVAGKIVNTLRRSACSTSYVRFVRHTKIQKFQKTLPRKTCPQVRAMN